MLDRQIILDRLAANADELHALGARSVALFGSFARDEAGEQSDVDLLVDLDQHTFDRYMDLKLRLEDLLERRVDLVLIDRLKPRVRDKILSEAIRGGVGETSTVLVALRASILPGTPRQAFEPRLRRPIERVSNHFVRVRFPSIALLPPRVRTPALGPRLLSLSLLLPRPSPCGPKTGSRSRTTTYDRVRMRA